MKGKTITLRTPIAGAVDRFGNATVTWATSTVDDVLISPGATSDLEASRPEGVRVAYTLHFPKTWLGNLEGCEVVLPAPFAGTYRVIGAPGQYMDENTPTRWHMPVEVEVAHG